MDLAFQQLEKARIFAYLSFLGITMPVAGIILAAISLSILNRLQVAKSDKDSTAEKQRLVTVANVGLVISILVIVFVALAVLLSFAVGLAAGSHSFSY